MAHGPCSSKLLQWNYTQMKMIFSAYLMKSFLVVYWIDAHHLDPSIVAVTSVGFGCELLSGKYCEYWARYWNTWNCYCNYPKLWTRCFENTKMYPKVAEGMASSIDLHQTASDLGLYCLLMPKLVLSRFPYAKCVCCQYIGIMLSVYGQCVVSL